MNYKYHISWVFCLLLLVSACKTLNTNVSIKENKLPEAYLVSKDTTTLASIPWKNYFKDPVLLNLIETGISNNYDLQIALERIEIHRANVRTTKGALLPQINLGIGGSINKYGLHTASGAGNVGTLITDDKYIPTVLPDMYVGLEASWEVDIWAKLRNKKKAALSNYLASIEGKNFVVSNLVADIAITYYLLLALDNELEIIKETIQKQQDALSVVQLQKESGRANELAVQQFSALILNSQVLEREISQQIIQTENRINFLLGRFPQPIERQKDVLFQTITTEFNKGIPSQLLLNRPDIRQAAYEVEATKFDLKAAQKAFLPSFNITAGIGYQAFNPEFLFISPASLAYNTIGSLITPLINRNALKAQFNVAKSNQLIAMCHYQQTIINGYTEVINEYSNIQNLQEINILKKQQSDFLNLSVETSNDLYKAGQASYLEILIAQQNSLQAKLDLIIANQRQRIAVINIYKALGGGWK